MKWMCFCGAMVIMNTCKKEIFDIYSAFIFFFKFYIKHVFYVSKTLRKLGELILQLIM